MLTSPAWDKCKDKIKVIESRMVFVGLAHISRSYDRVHIIDSEDRSKWKKQMNGEAVAPFRIRIEQQSYHALSRVINHKNESIRVVEKFFSTTFRAIFTIVFWGIFIVKQRNRVALLFSKRCMADGGENA